MPPTVESDIGLLIMQFEGSVSPEPIGKIISSGTVVEPVRMREGSGYWITGNPHVYFYMTPDGEHVDEDRRWVGDALIWQRGESNSERNSARKAAIEQLGCRLATSVNVTRFGSKTEANPGRSGWLVCPADWRRRGCGDQAVA